MNTQKIALITGGSRGIGKDIALTLARKGSGIILTYLSNRIEAEATVSAIESLDGKAVALPLNTADTSGFDAFFKQVQHVLRDTFDTERFDFLLTMQGQASLHR